jgi:eukaryotic-like serine/threonine-protein kinase
LPTAAKQHKWGVGAVVVLALLILSVAGVGVYSLLRRSDAKPFRNFTMTKITNSGNATLAAISPDSRFVLSVLNDKGRQSLWLRNIPTASDTQVLPPSDSEYVYLRFSPDGNLVYFKKPTLSAGNEYDLYRIPVLGGTPQKIIHNIDSGVAFSPDARSIGFMRCTPPISCVYFIATADGKDEKSLRSLSGPETPSSILSWEPNGRRLAYALEDPATLWVSSSCLTLLPER